MPRSNITPIRTRWDIAKKELGSVLFGMLFSSIGSAVYTAALKDEFTHPDTPIVHKEFDAYFWGGVGCIIAGIISITWKYNVPIDYQFDLSRNKKLLSMADATSQFVYGTLSFAITVPFSSLSSWSNIYLNIMLNGAMNLAMRYAIAHCKHHRTCCYKAPKHTDQTGSATTPFLGGRSQNATAGGESIAAAGESMVAVAAADDAKTLS